MPTHSKLCLIAVIPALLLSLSLSLSNNGTPTWYHQDEPKKLRFVEEHVQDYRHPLLMLQLIRSAVWVAGASNSQQIVETGRVVIALCFAVIVFCVWWLSADIVGNNIWALFAAYSTAVSPLLVVHSRYIKEDIPLAAWTMMSTCLVIKAVRYNSSSRSLIAGICAGCALSTHYKAVLLLPAWASILHATAMLRPARKRQLALTWAIGSIAMAIVVNELLSISSARDAFQGTSYELSHAIQGHDVCIPVAATYGLYFVKTALWSEMTPLPTLLGLSGLVSACWYVGLKDSTWRCIVIAVALLYAVPELSPLKPYPDACRYMVPVVPYLIISGMVFIKMLWDWCVMPKPFVAIVYALALLWSATDSALLVEYFNRDTRMMFGSSACSRRSDILCERYTIEQCHAVSAADLSVGTLKRLGVQVVVLSSFEYERYVSPYSRYDTRVNVVARRRNYEELFSHPHFELQPLYRSSAFSNPTIRIVYLSEPE